MAAKTEIQRSKRRQMRFWFGLMAILIDVDLLCTADQYLTDFAKADVFRAQYADVKDCSGFCIVDG